MHFAGTCDGSVPVTGPLDLTVMFPYVILIREHCRVPENPLADPTRKWGSTEVTEVND